MRIWPGLGSGEGFLEAVMTDDPPKSGDRMIWGGRVQTPAVRGKRDYSEN